MRKRSKSKRRLKKDMELLGGALLFLIEDLEACGEIMGTDDNRIQFMKAVLWDAGIQGAK